ncbi:MAG: helix-turn-helix domain-containing protein [Deltaproteobacteria bacterium]|nr:helix-turn-helix domain-containing protein [Deltaproteobacteria bacterium]
MEPKKKPAAKKRSPKRSLVERAKIPSERPGRPGGRRDTNRKERTKALTDAALVLFLERGIEAVTIEDITDGAGVAKGSFYRYFDDKTALVESMFLPLFLAVQESFDNSLKAIDVAKNKSEVAASYEVLAGGLVLIILNQADTALLYLQENRGPGRGARAPVIKLANLLSEKAIEHTARVREHGLLKPFAAELSTLVVIGAAERLLYAVLSGQLKGEALEVPGQLITLILDGIRVQDGSGFGDDVVGGVFSRVG